MLHQLSIKHTMDLHPLLVGQQLLNQEERINEKITFIQSKDPYFDRDLLQKTNITDTAYTENIYYFTEVNSSNLLFWCYENTTYFLISDFDYETSKDISQELLANKIH